MRLPAGSVFTLLVAGDRRLRPDLYDAIRVCLDRLLERRLPHVRLLSSGFPGANELGERWAASHHLAVERFVYDVEGLVRSPEIQCIDWMLSQRPSGLVVFEGVAMESAEIERRARVVDVPVRVVSVRRLVRG
jgi:hypothetical protein